MLNDVETKKTLFTISLLEFYFTKKKKGIKKFFSVYYKWWFLLYGNNTLILKSRIKLILDNSKYC